MVLSGLFRREIANYADYHRNERNALTHAFGIPIIFVAVVLPLDLWSFGAFGLRLTAADVAVAAVLVVWILLDPGIGVALIAPIAVLMLIAAAIVASAGARAVWLFAAALFASGWALQLLGHSAYEHRRPALLDNPVHLLIGPMFIMAKCLIALGLRRDLAAIIAPGAAGEPRSA